MVIAILTSIVALVAVGAWIVALLSLIAVVRLVPAGRRIEAIFSAGFWRFEKVRALTNNAADPHLQRFMWAFVVFFIVIIAGIFLGATSTLLSRQPSPSPQAMLAPAAAPVPALPLEI